MLAGGRQGDTSVLSVSAISIPHQSTAVISSDEIRDASSRLGPQLAALRAEQDKQRHSHRESYSMEHVQRLSMFTPMQPFGGSHSKVYCSQTHPQPCEYGCKTCHFCRQRTIDIKTVCSRCEGVNNFYGGPGRGYWCGSCLWARIGENIDEVKQQTDWICPGCRDLCNCSSPNCIRIKRGWFPTQTLWHEAKRQGFKSVAHYLVLTHVSAAASAAPIADNSHTARVMPAQRLAAGNITDTIAMPPVAKKQRTLDFAFGQSRREQALLRASQRRFQADIDAVLKELGGVKVGNAPTGQIGHGEMVSALQQLLNAGKTGHDAGFIRVGGNGTSSGGGFLGILDADMQDEDDGSAFGGNAVLSNTNLARQMSNRQGHQPNVGRGGISNNHTDFFPPRQPPSRMRPVIDAPLIVNLPEVVVPSSRHAYLLQLAGGLEIESNAGNAAEDIIHRGLPAYEDGDRYEGSGSRVQTSLRNPHLAISGWAQPQQREQPLLVQQPPLQSPTRSPIQRPAMATNNALEFNASHNLIESSRGDHQTPPRIMSELTSPVLPPTQMQAEEEEEETQEGMEVADINSAQNKDAADGSHRESQAGEQLEPAEVIPPLPPPSGQALIDATTNETAAVSPSGQQIRSSPTSVPPAPIEVHLPPCTDAHTPIAGLAATMASDEFTWNQLSLRASGIVHDFQTLSRHHPDLPNYIGPLFGAETDIAIYEAAVSS